MTDFLSGLIPDELLALPSEATPEPEADLFLEFLTKAAASPKGIALDARSLEGAQTLRFRLYRARRRFRTASGGSTSLDRITVRIRGSEVLLVNEPNPIMRDL